MRIFRFICWLRGWHANYFKVTKTDGLELYGDGTPCRVCGRMPLPGKTKGALLIAVYPYSPELERASHD